jgi:hypothetical protein
MGRPLKLSADYFPHDAHASDGETITILENHFGPEGYMAWFKLLERLTSSRNHVIDARKPESVEIQAAKLKLKPDLFLKIMDKLATLDAIDAELWGIRVIWSQNLVNKLAHLYERRNQEVPHRPNVSDYNNGVSSNHKPVSSVDIPPQLKKLKKETKETIICPYQDILNLWIELVPSLPKPEIPIDTSSPRARAIKSRWKQNQDLQIFQMIFSKVQGSDFMSGRKGDWSCNIDWVMKPANWQKIKEGNYDNKGVSSGNRERVPQRYTRPEELE